MNWTKSPKGDKNKSVIEVSKSPKKHEGKRLFVEPNWDNLAENFEEVQRSSTPKKKKQKQLNSSSESVDHIETKASRNSRDSFMEMLSLRPTEQEDCWENHTFLTPTKQEAKRELSDGSLAGSDKNSECSFKTKGKWNSLHTSIDLGEATDVKSERFSDKSFTDISDHHLSDSSPSKKRKKKHKHKNCINGSFSHDETKEDADHDLYNGQNKLINTTIENVSFSASIKEDCDDLHNKKRKNSQEIGESNENDVLYNPYGRINQKHCSPGNSELNTEEIVQHKKKKKKFETSQICNGESKNDEISNKLFVDVTQSQDPSIKKKKKKKKKHQSEDMVDECSKELEIETNNVHREENENEQTHEFKEKRKKHKRKKDEANIHKDPPFVSQSDNSPKIKKKKCKDKINHQDEKDDAHKKKEVRNSDAHGPDKSMKSQKSQKKNQQQNELLDLPSLESFSERMKKKKHKSKDEKCEELVKKIHYEKSWEDLQKKVENEDNLKLTSVSSVDLKRKNHDDVRVDQVKKFLTDHYLEDTSKYSAGDTSDGDNLSGLLKLDIPLDDVVKEIKESAVLSAQDIENLKNLKIMIAWSVPPLHMIETRVANRPTSIQKSQIEALQVPIKTGNFSWEEDKKIKKNWKKFCKVGETQNVIGKWFPIILHDLPRNPQPFLSFRTPDGKKILPTEERIKFVRYIANGLNDRMLCSVYNRFKKLFTKNALKVGRFSPKEDQMIIEFIKNTSSRTPFADLGRLLKRDKLSVERRCTTLVQQMKGDTTSFKWKRDNIEEFMKHFVDVLKVKNVEELKDREITPQEWKEMQERLNVPVEKLRNGWLCTLYPKFFAERRVTTAAAKQRLITLLIERGENDWRAVDWDSVAKDLSKEIEGFTGKKLMKMMRVMTDTHVNAANRHNLGECLSYLNTIKDTKIKGHRIKKLKVIDNRGQ